jgi:hypothetical protein
MVGPVGDDTSGPSHWVQASDGRDTILLHHLTLAHLRRIDKSLEEVGEYGEVRLRVEKGVVRFVEVVVSRRL